MADIKPDEIRIVKENEALVKTLAGKLNLLRAAILDMQEKPGSILTTWIEKWARYIIQEKTFKPDSLKPYKWSEIVYVDFGFRIGKEMGGYHYAVVVEIKNSIKNGMLTVVPMTSVSGEDDPKNKNNVYLGKDLIERSPGHSTAVINQLTSISKQKIVLPQSSSDFIGLVPDEAMKKLEEAIVVRYLKTIVAIMPKVEEA